MHYPLLKSLFSPLFSHYLSVPFYYPSYSPSSSLSPFLIPFSLLLYIFFLTHLHSLIFCLLSLLLFLSLLFSHSLASLCSSFISRSPLFSSPPPPLVFFGLPTVLSLCYSLSFLLYRSLHPFLPLCFLPLSIFSHSRPLFSTQLYLLTHPFTLYFSSPLLLPIPLFLSPPSSQSPFLTLPPSTSSQDCQIY